MLKRFYTVMIVPDARARFRRFQVSGRLIVAGAAVLGLLSVAALAAPWMAFRAARANAEVERLSRENAELQERSGEFEASVAELRETLASFERQTTRLAWMAGDTEIGSPEAGAGSGEIPGLSSETGSADTLRAELEVLRERSDALDARMQRVNELFETQLDRLASIPSILPVQGLIGHGFGWRRDPFTGQRRFHQGLDISAPEGTPVKAPADAVVVKTRRYGGYGNVVYLSHGNGLVTRYGHLHEYKVKPGERVRRGEIIATVGNTGRSTAPHLHYEVLLHNRRVDPFRYVVNTSLSP